LREDDICLLRLTCGGVQLQPQDRTSVPRNFSSSSPLSHIYPLPAGPLAISRTDLSICPLCLQRPEYRARLTRGDATGTLTRCHCLNPLNGNLQPLLAFVQRPRRKDPAFSFIARVNCPKDWTRLIVSAIEPMSAVSRPVSWGKARYVSANAVPPPPKPAFPTDEQPRCLRTFKVIGTHLKEMKRMDRSRSLPCGSSTNPPFVVHNIHGLAGLPSALLDNFPFPPFCFLSLLIFLNI
jgi:hypothetical protein